MVGNKIMMNKRKAILRGKEKGGWRKRNLGKNYEIT